MWKALAIVFSLIPFAGIAREAIVPVVQILDQARGQHLCTGIMLDKKRVLTARHCLSSSDARRYTVQLPELKYLSSVEKVYFYENDSRYFPNRDLALLDLTLPLDETIIFPGILEQRLQPGLKVLAYGRGFQDRQLAAAKPGSLKRIEGVLETTHSGYRIEHLIRFASRSKALCVGDSGGPLLVKKGGVLTLIGWINGLWDPITESEGSCAMESVVTPAGPYAAWIKRPHSSDHSRSVRSFQDLESACRANDIASDRYLLVQKILVQLVEATPDRQHQLAMLSQCRGVNHAWDGFLRSGRPLVLDIQTDLAGMDFLKSLRGLELANVTPQNIRDLAAFTSLETLTLNGATQRIDLGVIQIGKLRRVSLKNIKQLSGFKTFLQNHAGLQVINIMDIHPMEGTLAMSWFSGLKALNRLKIGMMPVARDLDLHPNISIRTW